MDELLSKDPLFLTFKEKIGNATASPEEKVQISQRITRLMDNSITRLSAKIDEFGEERRVIEETQAEIARNMELRNARKKQKEDALLAESASVEESQTYCICGKVVFLNCSNLAFLWRDDWL